MQNYLAYMYCNLTLNLIEWLRVRPIQRESVKGIYMESVKGIYMENFAVYRNVLAGTRKAFLCMWFQMVCINGLDKVQSYGQRNFYRFVYHS